VIASTPHLRLAYRGSQLKALSERTVCVLDSQPQPTAEDIRIHSWINERLAVINRERNSIWAKVKKGDILSALRLR
jgi:hypothetical protein